MNINVDGIKNYLQFGYQFVVEQGRDYSVKVLKQALDHIRQDSRLAGVTVAVSNILFLEIALRITFLVDRGLIRLFGPEEWSEKANLANSVVVLMLNFSLVVGMNAALYQSLSLPLSSLVTTAISTATCTSYILFRFFK